MDLIPPSYESATDRDAWSIIARYIPSSDLCAASLVCQRWHGLFMPFLWGDPASHFGQENDAVYGKYNYVISVEESETNPTQWLSRDSAEPSDLLGRKCEH